MVDFGLAVAVIVMLSEVLKQQGLPTRFVPLVNLTLGLAAGVFFMGLDLRDGIVQGILIGLSASGLYDQAKILRGGK